MYAAYGKNTLRGAKGFVEDTGINIAPRKMSPREKVAALAKAWQAEQEAKREAARREAEAARWAFERARLKEEQARLEAARQSVDDGLELPEAITSARYRPSARRIEERLLRVLGVTPREIRSSRRNRDLVFARQALAYWLCRLTPASLPAVGRYLGGRDHTTIIHSKQAYVEKRRSGFGGRKPRYLRAVR